MSRLVSMAMLATALAFGGGPVALAQNVEWSGRVYHVRVCPGPSVPGSARCHAHIVTDRGGNHLVNLFGRNARANVVPSGYGPSDLRSAYNVASSGSPTTIVAIVDAFGYTSAEADLGVYRSTYGLPACTSANGCFAKYNQNGVKGSYPRENVGWAEETALDLDMVSAMCPNCRIVLVEASSNSYANLATAENMAARLGAHVISNSYGGGESGTQFFESAYNHPGVAVTASTGDSGYNAGAEFPATSPHRVGLVRRRQRLQQSLRQAGVAERPAVHDAHGGRRLGDRRPLHGRRRLWARQFERFRLANLRRHQRRRAAHRWRLRRQRRGGELWEQSLPEHHRSVRRDLRQQRQLWRHLFLHRRPRV